MYNSNAQRTMDIQLCDSYLIYLVLISRYTAVKFKILIYVYFNILDIAAEHLDITTVYIIWPFQS